MARTKKHRRPRGDKSAPRSTSKETSVQAVQAVPPPPAGRRAGIGPRIPQAKQKKPGTLPEKDSADWWGLLSHAGFLREATNWDFPGAKELRERLIEATGSDDDWKYDVLPEAEVIVAAIESFYALPEESRRKMLHGWSMDRWPSNSEIDEMRTPHLVPMLTIEAGCRHANGAAMADHRLFNEDSTAKVFLHVRVGTTQHETLRALWELQHLVETQWPTLIDDPLGAADRPLPSMLTKAKPSGEHHAK